MPKLQCKCGEIIDLSEIPTKGEYFFFSTEDWDKVVEIIADTVPKVDVTDSDLLQDAISDMLAGLGRYFYICPHCGGLLMESKNKESFQSFDPSPPLHEKVKGNPES